MWANDAPRGRPGPAWPVVSSQGHPQWPCTQVALQVRLVPLRAAALVPRRAWHQVDKSV